MLVSVSLEDAVLSTTAHEFFHVLQDYAALHGQGDIEEPAFVEPLATAIQELAAPDADDYLDAAIDFLRAPDDAPFLGRGYDAGIFWVFVLERYGLDAIRRVMAASAAADGARAIDLAFAGDGLSFLDVWAKFAAAWATGTLPDAAARAELAHAWRRETGLAGLDRPPVDRHRTLGRPPARRRSRHRGRIRGAAQALVSLRHRRRLHPRGVAGCARHRDRRRDSRRPPRDCRRPPRRRVRPSLPLVGSPRSSLRSPTATLRSCVVLTRGEVGSGAYAVRLAPAT